MTSDQDHIASIEASAAQKAKLLQQMDVTMVQKLAFASAHFQLHDGARILDIGCARGFGSYQLALLNPRLQVVGLDYDAAYIAEANEKYKLPNLSFIQGDARNLDLGEDKFDAILNSSVMHEVYSYSGYDEKAVQASMQSQLDVLKHGGVILLRDFMRAPEPDRMVYMDIPDDKADLLTRYAASADAEKAPEEQGFFLQKIGAPQEGWQRFYLPYDRAYEFIWRKEYEDRFEPESHEKYSFWKAAQYREIPEEMGARVVYTAPYHNPWIVRNWLDGQVTLYDEDMQALELPPSNYISVIRKTAEGEGIKLYEHRLDAAAPSYLKKERFENQRTGKALDLVSRPGEVADVIPYGVNDNGHLVIYAKSSYPRPIVNIHPRAMTANIDGRTWSGHMVEPLAIANRSAADMEDGVREVLQDRAGFEPEQIKTITKAMTYYTAPSDVNERVSSVFVNVNAAPYEHSMTGHFSGFASDGSVRAFDVQDILRGVQVGMLPEARLEMNIYTLMRKLGVTPEPWIGDAFPLARTAQALSTQFNQVAANTDHFVQVQFNPDDAYMDIHRSNFVERAKDGVLATQTLEFAVPAHSNKQSPATNSVIILPVLKRDSDGEILVGLKSQSFPSVQQHEGQGGISGLPGYNVPVAVKDRLALNKHICQREGLDKAAISPLGESYFPSMGILPHRVYPYIVSDQTLADREDLDFVPLREVFAQMDDCKDAHLIIAVYRAVHALGLWQEYAQDMDLTAAQRLTL